MDSSTTRKCFGARIKKLRKERNWTQRELATKLSIRFSHLNKYEAGLHIPPIEKIIQLAEILDTTVEYLLKGNHADDALFHNGPLLERFRALAQFNTEDQGTIIKLIDAFIIKSRVEVATKPFKK